jgi:sugar lactone lactonase YvrE
VISCVKDRATAAPIRATARAGLTGVSRAHCCLMRVEQITDPVAFHGEGPVWWEAWDGLRWVDMLAGDVLSLGADGSIERRHVGKVAAALRPRRAGGAVIAVERGFVLEETDGTLSDEVAAWSDPGVRMNDGGCDPDGRFYCGSMAYDRRRGGAALYRLDPELSVHRALEGLTISNGLDWSPDGAVAYHVDTELFRIDVFDYAADSGLINRRPFARIDESDGRPDGLTVDADGGVWVALNGGGAVRRYTSDGRLDAVVGAPTPHVTACTFGGSNLRSLFITTSRENVKGDVDPIAGSLLACEPGATGLPTRPFAG